MALQKKTVVFVHGWSVTHTSTYGSLPERLVNETGGGVSVEHVFLGKYISFHDEVRLEDISRAFERAVRTQLTPRVKEFGRFACITHSTGGPVIRDWKTRYYDERPSSGRCPMSHLVMLAPANFGSALAQLGKARVGRIKAWWHGVEPGEGVLDWLELGSPDSWELNERWIRSPERVIGANGFFPFVITGQTIDREFYDHLNSYTGEPGSDGVVRTAAANLNATYVKLRQLSEGANGEDTELQASRLEPVEEDTHPSPRTAMLVVPGKSHSGESIGIMRSVTKATGHEEDAVTVQGILDCLAVETKDDYKVLCDKFDRLTEQAQKDERLEIVEKDGIFGSRERTFFHDRHSMVIFRLQDEEGYPIEDFDLTLIGGNESGESSPNYLPEQFLVDRQRNTHHRGTLTYYFNHDAMCGCDPVIVGEDPSEEGYRVYRKKWDGIKLLGIIIDPRPQSGFAHYLPCRLEASADVWGMVLEPNQTTLVDIVLRRVVYEDVFQLDRDLKWRSFKNTRPRKRLP